MTTPAPRQAAALTALAIGIGILSIATLAACGGGDDDEGAEPPGAGSSSSTAPAGGATTRPPTESEPPMTSEPEDRPAPPPSLPRPPGEPAPPGSSPASQPTGDDDPGALDEQASAAVGDLAARLGVDAGAITVRTDERVTWRDGSLGCPQPGRSYTQALVPGRRLVLEPGGTTYAYHGARTGELFACASPDPNGTTPGGPDD